jgi:hypothetical protein
VVEWWRVEEEGGGWWRRRVEGRGRIEGWRRLIQQQRGITTTLDHIANK